MTVKLLSHSAARFTFVVALLAILALSQIHSAGAQPKGTPGVSEAGTVQALMCEGLGGKADVTEVRTPGSGLTSTTVKCNGGMADGISCTNNSSGTNCSSKAVLPGGSKSGPNLSQIEQGTFDWQAYKAAHQTTPTATPAPVNK